MKELTKGNFKNAGEWSPIDWFEALSVDPWFILHKSAVVGCPNCNRPFHLRKHQITAEGNVSPSVVCPRQGCDFHEFIILKDF